MVRSLVAIVFMAACGCSLIVGNEPRPHLETDAGDAAAPQEAGVGHDAGAVADAGDAAGDAASACVLPPTCVTAAQACEAKCAAAYDDCIDDDDLTKCTYDAARCRGECSKKCIECARDPLCAGTAGVDACAAAIR
jgi:hypothetical protein